MVQSNPMTDYCLYLILHFLINNNMAQSAHILERETRLFLDVNYVTELITSGLWDEVEQYLLGFTTINNNWHSRSMFFEIRKHKYLELLYKQDMSKVLEALMDLKMFEVSHKNIFEHLSQLVTIHNIREHPDLIDYWDTQSVRIAVSATVKNLIQQNPNFDGRLQIPDIRVGLDTIVAQSTSCSCQHQNHIHGVKPQPPPSSAPLFPRRPIDSQGPSPISNTSRGETPRAGNFTPSDARQPSSSPRYEGLATNIIPSFPLQQSNPLVVNNVSNRPIGVQGPSPVSNTPRGQRSRAGYFSPSDAHEPSPYPPFAGRATNSIPRFHPGSSSGVSGSSPGPPVGIIRPVARRRRVSASINRSVDRRRAQSEDVPWRSLPFGSSNQPPVLSSVGASSSNASRPASGADQAGPTNMRNRGFMGQLFNLDLLMNSFQNLQSGLSEINEPSSFHCMKVNGDLLELSCLVYSNSGDSLIALASDGVYSFWKWQESAANMDGKVTTAEQPLWRVLRSADTDSSNKKKEKIIGETDANCLAISSDDSYILSASAGSVNIYHLPDFKKIPLSAAESLKATFIAMHPENDDIVAVGMPDSTIHIYNYRLEKLRGHTEKVTGLVFSKKLDVLVSSGADTQVCVWSTIDQQQWWKECSASLPTPTGQDSAPPAGIYLQFHCNDTELLVVHETGLAIYEVSHASDEAPDAKQFQIKLIRQWVPEDPKSRVTCARYSCDGESIYASFADGNVGVLAAATLTPKCWIRPEAYMREIEPSVHPLVVAAHPSKPHQFALGLSNGGVYVLEPLSTHGQWGTVSSSEDSAAPMDASG